MYVKRTIKLNSLKNVTKTTENDKRATTKYLEGGVKDVKKKM